MKEHQKNNNNEMSGGVRSDPDSKIIALSSSHSVDVADKFRSTSCTFQTSDFVCGYTTTELGAWRWTRQTGKDSNPLTGPESDANGNSFG